MQSESTGKIITKINVFKSKVSIYFGKKEKIDVSPDVYTDSYFYVGKELSEEEILKIEKNEYIQDAYSTAIALLSKAMYTEWGLRDKLYNHEFHKSTVDEVIKKLKKAKLINDKRYIKEYIEYADDKGYGKNKIIQELKKRGIFDEMIKDIRFSETKETSKAKSHLPTLEKQYGNLPTSDKRQHIFNTLIRYGFDTNIAIEVCKKIKATPKSVENLKLKKDFEAVLAQARRKYSTLNGVKAYLFRTLSQKGYSIGQINEYWGLYENEATSGL